MNAPAAWWPPGPSPQARVHRRVLRGYGRRRSRPAFLIDVTRDRVAWRRSAAEAALAEVEDPTGRLHELARYGVHPRDAHVLGLDRDDRFQHWTDYLSDRHRQWNIAAGGRRARPDIELLTDKWATQQVLAPLGIPIAPSLLLPAGRPVGEAVRAFRAVHGSAFTKPNTGSGGRGAARVEGDPPTPTEDLLLQPALTSHRDFAEVADLRDVVTQRVVTRNLGDGPQLFCATIEVPRPTAYAVVQVDSDGRVGRTVRPAWVGEVADQPLAAWEGRVLPEVAAGIEVALRAHSAVPRMFAVAWDLALTPEGPVLLEGNTGFGTRVPQWIAGGLLDGMEQ